MCVEPCRRGLKRSLRACSLKIQSETGATLLKRDACLRIVALPSSWIGYLRSSVTPMYRDQHIGMPYSVENPRADDLATIVNIGGPQ